jgi:hypothetical protein
MAEAAMVCALDSDHLAHSGCLERGEQWRNDYKIAATYSYTHGLQLNRSRNINVANPILLTTDFRIALALGLAPSPPLSV